MNSSAVGLRTVLLTALIGALAALNWYVVTLQIPVEPASSTQRYSLTQSLPAPMLPAQTGATATTAPSRLRDFNARPLFQPDRRPFSRENATSAGSAEAPVSASGLALVGIMQDQTGAKRALIRNSDVAAEWVGVGGTVDGWVVKAIDNSGLVVVETRGRRSALRLYGEP